MNHSGIPPAETNDGGPVVWPHGVYEGADRILRLIHTMVDTHRITLIDNNDNRNTRNIIDARHLGLDGHSVLSQSEIFGNKPIEGVS